MNIYYIFMRCTIGECIHPMGARQGSVCLNFAPRTATGQCACGFGVKTRAMRKNRSRFRSAFLLVRLTCLRAPFTPKPGRISQSPRSALKLSWSSTREGTGNSKSDNGQCALRQFSSDHERVTFHPNYPTDEPNPFGVLSSQGAIQPSPYGAIKFCSALRFGTPYPATGRDPHAGNQDSYTA